MDDGASPARSDIRGLKQEFHALKQEHEQVKRRVGQLEQQRSDAVDALAAATGLSRRQVMGIIAGGASMGALGALAVGDARAAASTSDSEGDIGGPNDRSDLWTDGINYNVAAISSATTVSAPVVRYDCSVSGFTITLDSALEPSNGTQCVVLIDETGSAGSNSVTVDTQSGNNIDGGSSITINHNNAVTILWWDSSEWRSTRFIDTVDARQVDIAQVAGKASLTTNQTISTGSVTDMNLDQNDIEDTDVVDVQLSNNRLQIAADGVYEIYTAINWAGSANWSGDETIECRITVNGSLMAKEVQAHHGQNIEYGQSIQTVESLTSGDNIETEVFHDRGGDESLNAADTKTYLEVSRLG